MQTDSEGLVHLHFFGKRSALNILRSAVSSTKKPPVAEVLKKEVTNVFTFPKTGFLLGMHSSPWIGFPQASPEIKNGKVTDYKKV